MTTSSSDPSEEVQIPPYPSYEDTDRDGTPCGLTRDGAQRLLWRLDSPLSTAISIMKDRSNPESLEQYFQPSTGTWHPVSQLPLTEPKISSVTVSVYDLEEWEDNWLEINEEHSSPDGGDENEPSALYGPLPNPDPNKDEGGSSHLLRCCDEVRPRGKATKLVVSPTAWEHGFITVHDYVSAVHPWLMSMQEEILQAREIFGHSVTDLVVFGLDVILIQRKET